ncbi:DNA-cytosine methyltransferase [Halalkalibacter wakoensis JCM 9140]|uniref:Cytosine-specific methyltransferase n=1 Tax=Halalkalibacter wakoensis JCM 9140 TaxID=1236970 RepID=W4Q8C8_9BACI|nr:DNA (cytosine-5-)-methyltransferase [Halalkalibacter wakoensis]GAE28240.1 DNA-cytosine methyltransferase [Halalkalibacter wakoensis JCM 9140]
MEKLKVVDLFSGAGGLSAGFEQTGCFEVVAAVELDKYARMTYKRNHKRLKDDLFFKDIRDIKEAQIELLKETGVEVVIGGPPCQGFSNANRQKNSIISSNNQLVKDYIKVIEKLEPLIFVMENVNTMRSDKHKFFLSYSDKEELEDLNLVYTTEKIIIGDSSIVSEPFIKSLDEISKIDPFLIEEDVFSKIGSLLRQRSIDKVKTYLEKQGNFNYFDNLIQRWENLHQKYIGQYYIDEWDSLGNCLGEILLGEDNNNLLKHLSFIIETQKTLMKLKELLHHQIDFKIEDSEGNIVVNLKTYNVFEYVKEKFKSIGYRINEDEKYILNAANFGVPQFRKRLFIVGAKEQFLNENNQIIKLPDEIIINEESYYRIGDAIQDLEELDTSTDVNAPSISIRGSNVNVKTGINKYYNENNTYEIYNHVRTDTRENCVKTL